MSEVKIYTSGCFDKITNEQKMQIKVAVYLFFSVG